MNNTKINNNNKIRKARLHTTLSIFVTFCVIGLISAISIAFFKEHRDHPQKLKELKQTLPQI